MSLIKSYFRIYSVPNPRAWLNAHLKSPDVVIFDQKHSIKPLKLCFPCYLSWISSFFPLSLPVTILLFRLIFSAILFIILYSVTFCFYFLPFVFASLLPACLFFSSFLPSSFHCCPHWRFSCFYSIFVLPFSLLPLFLPCASDFFLLALCKHHGSQLYSLIDWLVVRIPVSFTSRPSGRKRRDVEVDTLQF